MTPAVTVAVEDANGNVETGDNGTTVALAFGTNAGGGTLTGGSAVPCPPAWPPSRACPSTRPGPATPLSPRAGCCTHRPRRPPSTSRRARPPSWPSSRPDRRRQGLDHPARDGGRRGRQRQHRDRRQHHDSRPRRRDQPERGDTHRRLRRSLSPPAWPPSRACPSTLSGPGTRSTARRLPAYTPATSSAFDITPGHAHAARLPGRARAPRSPEPR